MFLRNDADESVFQFQPQEEKNPILIGHYTNELDHSLGRSLFLFLILFLAV